MIYRIALKVNEKTLFLRYVEKMIFTDTIGYVWKKEHLLKKVLPDIQRKYPNAYVHTISDEDYNLIKDGETKATIIFPETKRGRKPKSEVEQVIKPAEYNVNDLSSLKTDPALLDDEEEDENILFRKLNAHCIKCVRACKQSWLATIVRCEQFTPVDA